MFVPACRLTGKSRTSRISHQQFLVRTWSTAVSMTCRQLDERALEEGFLDKFDHVICDLDGVVWIGRNALPKASDALGLLRKLGKKILFLSNDDHQTREQKQARLRGTNIEAEIEDIFTSAYLAADCAQLLEVPKDKEVYVMARKAVADELQAAGYTCLEVGPELPPDDPVAWFHSEEVPKEKVGAVVVGFDLYFTYPKLLRAMEYLKDEEVTFISTFEDKYIARPGGRIIPGPASLVSAVSMVSDRTPFLVGKPGLFAFDAIRRQHPTIDPERCLVIGDSLESDMKFGNTLSMTTLLVLTGTDNLNDVRRVQNDTKSDFEVPDFHVASLERLHELLLPMAP